MQMIQEKLAPINALVANYQIRTQVFALIGLEMFFVFLLWIIPPPITAPFDLAAFVAFLGIIACVFYNVQQVIKYVKYYIMLHVFILILYILVYEVIFNWIVKPGPKEQTLGIFKVILIIISCLIDGVLYIKWNEFTTGAEQRETDFPDTVTSTDPNQAGYTDQNAAYQDTQNY